MASKPRRRNTIPVSRARSPTPEYVVDLTVDSPAAEPSRRPSVIRIGRYEDLSNLTIDIIDTDEVDCSNCRLPPKKRSRKDKSAQSEKIDVGVVPKLNDTVSGQSEDISCPVCLEPLASKLKPTSTRCGHVYCADCLEKTLNTSKKCPKCQSKITPKSCIRLYF